MVWSSDVGDQEIVQLIRDDPHQGFTILLQQYGGRIRGYLRKRFPSLDDSDLHDAMTDAMLALANSFDGRRGTLPAWFLLLAHQQAVRLLRAMKSRPLTEVPEGRLAEVDGSGDPLAMLESLERLDEVDRAVRSLPTLERAVLEADLAAGCVVAAQKLALRLSTTEGSIYAARKRGRTKLINRCGWVRDWLQGGNRDHG